MNPGQFKKSMSTDRTVRITKAQKFLTRTVQNVSVPYHIIKVQG